jgi:beta-galactosidase
MKKRVIFYAVGLGGRTYGIIWPDREIQPEIYQIKKSGQPVKIEPVDVENGKVKITNRHEFKNLIELVGMWQMSVNGDTIQRGFFELDLPAGQSVVDSIPFRMPTIESDSECMLMVSFLLKDNTNWADASHEIAWDEMVVKTPVFAEEKIVLKGKSQYRKMRMKFTFRVIILNIQSAKKPVNLFHYYLTELNIWKVDRHLTFGGRRLPTTLTRGEASNLPERNYTPGFGRSIDNQLAYAWNARFGFTSG